MAKSLTAPWIRSAVLDAARDTDATPPPPAPWGARKGKVVQVLRCNDSVRCIEVSDKESSVAVMLTDACYQQLIRRDSEFSLSGCRNCIVKLDAWHLSTIVQAAGNRDVSKFGDLDISFPFALQCSKLTLLGAADCTRIGEPRDVNRDPAVRSALANTDYISLVERLRARQFPGEASLPDPDGAFSLPHLYSDAHPLLWEHAVVPAEQSALLAGRAGTGPAPVISSTPVVQSCGQGEDDRSASTAGRYTVLSPPSSGGGLELQPTQVDTQVDTHADPALVVLWKHGSGLISRLVHDFPSFSQTESQTQLGESADGEGEGWVEPTQVATQTESPPAGAAPAETPAREDPTFETQGHAWFTQPLGEQFIHEVELRLNVGPHAPVEALHLPVTLPAGPVPAAGAPVPRTDTSVTVENYASEELNDGSVEIKREIEDNLIGKSIVKKFKGFGVFRGKVVSRRRIYTRRGRAAQQAVGTEFAEGAGDFLYRVLYEDGDAEEMEEAAVRKHLTPEMKLKSNERALQTERLWSKDIKKNKRKGVEPVARPIDHKRRRSEHKPNSAHPTSQNGIASPAPAISNEKPPIFKTTGLSTNLIQALSFLEAVPGSGVGQRINDSIRFSRTKYA